MPKGFGWLTDKLHPLTSEEKKQVLTELVPSATPGYDYFILVILSGTIATLGLMTNSPAVIIGAMLLAPLMSPIITLGLSIVIGDTVLLRRSLITLVEGVLISGGLAALITLFNSKMPFINFQQLSDEIMTRTHPSPLDLTIALAGGLAGAYALTRKNLSAALPGVAIATALMPPLCAVGIGVALGRWEVASGALLLFVTNAIAIAFASALVFFLRGFRPRLRENNHLLPRNLAISAILTFLLLVPLTYYSIQFFQNSTENRQIYDFAASEVERITGSELVDLTMYRNENVLHLTLTVRTLKSIPYEKVVVLQKALVAGLDRPISLKVNQVFAQQLDPLVPPTPTRTATSTATPHPNPTNTQMPTATATPLPSATPLPTATNTPLPLEGKLVRINAPTLQLYQSPGGPVIGTLRVNQSILVMNQTQVYGGYVWRLVQDAEGRVGWVPDVYIQLLPTPTPVIPTP